MKNNLSILFLGLLLFSSAVFASENISELILSNGLKIIVKPDHRTPVAAFQIWYKVGSAYEYDGVTGISHMLEHLMYKGNNNPHLAENFHHLNDIGARGNAFTTRDHTYYYHILEKNHLALAFKVEAARIQYLSPSIEEFNIEKKVIREEMHVRINRDPYLPVYNALFQYAFPHNGYQFPIIGRSKDINSLSLAKTMSWYKNNYTPDNATIVVVGDVKAAEVFELAKKYFSGIKKMGPASKIQSFAEGTQTLSKKKENRYIMPDRTKVGMILLAFKVPSIKTSMPEWEAYALEVLAGWFESGTNSRLTKTLIRKQQLAHEISISYSPMTRQQSLFIIEALPAENASLTQLEQALDREIKLIKNEFISKKTLQKIKNQMIAADIFDRDSIHTQAKIIGQAESVGIHWTEDARYISRIKDVTAEQVKDVLHKYFIPANKIVILQYAR